jgi:hypothetical protein
MIMENATQRTTSKDNAAIHREMAELQEHQGWVHHVADAATGKVLTTQLDHPVSPVSRAQRLSQLGDQFDFSIFGMPTHRLTPQRPYQASPLGFLRFYWAREVSSLTDIQAEGHAVWGVPNVAIGEAVGSMESLVFEPPQGRCLATVFFGAKKLPGQTATIRIQVLGYLDNQSTVLASFQLTEHRDNFFWHTVDLLFTSVPPPNSSLHWVNMDLESGLQYVQFASLQVAPTIIAV